MQNEECRMQNAENANRTSAILHSSFFILHSAFLHSSFCISSATIMSRITYMTAPSRSSRLRTLMADHTVVLPGAFNALTARAIHRAGFEAIYLSGATLANGLLGVPDVGLTTLSEASLHATRCAAVTRIPIISDADTGFGGSDNAARTVQDFERAGLSGM